MKLYVTLRSPYARLARILVLEKGLEDRVEIIQAKTRTLGSPYYQINPSGRVPFLVDDAGIGIEDSQLLCAYLDSLTVNLGSTTRSVRPIGFTCVSNTRRAACVKESACGDAKWAVPKASVRRPFLHMRWPAQTAWQTFLRTV